LPKGVLLEGRSETVHAPGMMRGGSAFIAFEPLVLSEGSAQPISVHLVSVNSNAAKSDSEGLLRPTRSKKHLATELGGSALAAKLADDLSEVIGGAAISAAIARYFGLAATTVFLMIHKGREVILHRGEEIEVEFRRGGPVVTPD
jgi:hypothetical protein